MANAPHLAGQPDFPRSTDTALSALLENLFAGLLDDQPWDAFLQSLAAWLDASFATLILTAPGLETPGAMRTPGADPKTNDDYLASFFATDPFQGLPEGQVTAFAEFVRETDDPAIAAYRDFLAQAGGDQVLGVDLRFPSGFEARCRVTRDASLTDFGLQERQRFQSVVPHLRNAAALFERLQLAGAEHGVYRSAVEQLGVGTIILDAAGKIVRTNAVADRLLEQAEGLTAQKGELEFTDTAHRDAMARLLAHQDALCRFKISRPRGSDLALVARPMTLPAMIRGGAAVAIFISVPGDDMQLDPAAIRDLYQLTRMEAVLAVEIAGGHSLVDVADKLGIAHNTARAHLRAIFAKTGVRRQSQLVHLLKSGLA